MNSRGTQVYFTDGTTLYQVGCLMSVTPVSDPIGAVDQTPLGASATTSAPGLVTLGQFSMVVKFDGSNAAIQALNDAYENRTTLKWCLLLSESTSTPSLSSGAIVPPASRTSYLFEGWLMDRATQIAAGQTVQLNVPIQRTTAAVVELAA